jgi:hypothetical protein
MHLPSIRGAGRAVLTNQRGCPTAPGAKARGAAAVVLDGQPRGLANRAHPQRQGSGSIGFNGCVRIEACSEQFAAKGEDGSMTVRGDSGDRTGVAAYQFGADKVGVGGRPAK